MFSILKINKNNYQDNGIFLKSDNLGLGTTYIIPPLPDKFNKIKNVTLAKVKNRSSKRKIKQ